MSVLARPVSAALRFGFACMPAGVPQPVVHSCRLENATPARLRELTALNLESLDRCLGYCASLGLSLFRVSSNLIPFASHPVNRLDWEKESEPELRALGRKARRLGLRLSLHPGQFTVLNSPNPRVTEAAVAELNYQARLLDALDAPESSKIVVHLGGVYGDKAAALARLKGSWRRLRRGLRRRLVLENDERLFSVYDALDAGEELGAPVVFDRFHHRVHGDPLETPIGDLLRRAAATWSSRDGRQKVHFSSQRPGDRPGTHGEDIDPAEFERFLEESEGLSFDVMIEARLKERAALRAQDLARRAGRCA